MTVSNKTNHAFLLAPPPIPKRRRPLQPIPCSPPRSRPRSASCSTLTPSPRRRSRGQSVSQRSPCTPLTNTCIHAHASFLILADTPSPQPIQVHLRDLEALGYATAFSAPKTAKTPELPRPTEKGPALKKIRSIPNNMFKSSSSKAAKSAKTPKVKADPEEVPYTTRSKRSATPLRGDVNFRPIPFMATIELAQFLDGGSIEHHVKKAQRTHARSYAKRTRIGGAGGFDGDVGFGGSFVIRGDDGMIWYDMEEMQEYAHLLGGGEDGASDLDGVMQATRRVRSKLSSEDHTWVDFSGPSSTPSGISEEDDGDDLALYGGSDTFYPSYQSVLFMPRSPSHTGALFPSIAPSTPSSAGKSKGKARRRPPALTIPFPSPRTRPALASPRSEFLASSYVPYNPSAVRKPSLARKRTQSLARKQSAGRLARAATATTPTRPLFLRSKASKPSLVSPTSPEVTTKPKLRSKKSYTALTSYFKGWVRRKPQQI